MSKEAALAFCENRRTILPRTYNECKAKQAQRHNTKLILNQNDINDFEEIDPEKQRIRNDILAKISAMNELCFDLTTEEIDLYQQILESDDEENDSLNEEFERDSSSVQVTEPNKNDISSELNSLQQNHGTNLELNSSIKFKHL